MLILSPFLPSSPLQHTPDGSQYRGETLWEGRYPCNPLFLDLLVFPVYLILLGLWLLPSCYLLLLYQKLKHFIVILGSKIKCLLLADPLTGPIVLLAQPTPYPHCSKKSFIILPWEGPWEYFGSLWHPTRTRKTGRLRTLNPILPGKLPHHCFSVVSTQHWLGGPINVVLPKGLERK